MTWPAPTAQRWIEHRRCLSCEAGQRTTPHEPCWWCGGPTVEGALWPAGAGILTEVRLHEISVLTDRSAEAGR